MDIVSSIEFGSLDLDLDQDKPPTALKQHHGIDVNHRVDIYTSPSTSCPIDAPPVYQKDHPSDGNAPTISQAPYTAQVSKRPHENIALKTIPRTPPRTTRGMQSQWDEPRRPLQLPKAESAPLTKEVVKAPAMGYTRARETTVLCELTGVSMGFTQPDDAMPGRMGLVKGASTCIIRVTSRRKSAGPGQIRVKRSIWVFAEGGKLCIQQKLPNDSKIIPYTLWGNETKVIIRHPTELRYYATPDSESPCKKTKTSWVTYAFGSPCLSAEFQSALLPPLSLIRTMPTTRVVRLHKSLWVRTFSPRLLICGLENLRIFQDLSDRNSLVCMIHYSPNFHPLNGEEYIIFRLYPPPRNSVRIREDGEKCVKIKGLDIRGFSANEQKKKGKAPQSQVEKLEEEAYGSHSIEKIQIQFGSEKEKCQFLELTRELQGLSTW